ncbi:unnamed protein product [Cyprideis torosa]|uniref:Dipeptidyl peptidase 3 n=1 Tax=Cyprideis torosa TaxID=163714 RepID=A0A7R8W9Z1_9CRUS|nr:unnamed protein product [Cyprideis torosa]CAG0890395.1 unnamed protein product [Cyprideis torosa]
MFQSVVGKALPLVTSSLRWSCDKSVVRLLQTLRTSIANNFAFETMPASTYKPVPVSTEFVFPASQPVVYLDCEKAFEGLTQQEKLYAHFLSEACWRGGLIIPFQTSRESPLIFLLLVKLFGQNGRNIEVVRQKANAIGLSDVQFQAILVYAAAFFFNFGNYKGYGDTKFVPDIPRAKFDELMKAVGDETLLKLYDELADDLFSLNERNVHLGLSPKGVTTYHSSNISLEDSDLVARFLEKNEIPAWNSRLFKVDENSYEVRLAAALTGSKTETKTFEGKSFKVVAGDYELFLKDVLTNLSEAKKYAANDNQSKMLEKYMESFEGGSVDAHKDGSRFWIKDKGPAVESYIGFIETYRDPAGNRGEWEGFVAVVNRELSKKFQNLVANAEKLLPLLPWDQFFEKDKFLKPDFTSLDVVAFASSGIPAGINIPNYDEIRQSEGFKNVNLGNVIQCLKKSQEMPFLSKKDAEFLKKIGVEAFELQVGLHELLGHGCGKLFYEKKDSSFNFDKEKVVNPLTGGSITSWFKDGETYDSKFGPLASSYEECRAESCALHLNLFPEVLEAFGLTEPKHAADIQWACWLQLLWDGLKSLEMYQPSDKSWLQSHAQARFVILQVMLEADLVSIEEIEASPEDGKPDLLLKVDRSKLKDVGGPAMSKFLQKLQVFKATGDVESAKSMYMAYSAVNDKFLKWRSIVIDRKQPRKMLVQPITQKAEGGDTITLKVYPASVEGLIQSYVDRYCPIFESSGFEEEYRNLWARDEASFRI